MGKYFGTDGFRGMAGEELTALHAFKIGAFLAQHYGKEKTARIVIGKDTRRSSYMLEYSMCSGIVAFGGDAYLLHVTTTPSLSYVASTEDFDCAVMISASHNPFYDNGIKLINSRGEKMEDEVIQKAEEFIDKDFENAHFSSGKKIGKTVDYVAGRNRYCAYLISLCSHSYKGINIGLDTANGSAWMLAKSVFDALGAKTHVINNTPDGFNINDMCGSTHIETLRKKVISEKLDIGFAFDGDGDRCICVDRFGNVLTGDHIIYLCAKYMKEKGELAKNTVVATIMSNMGLFKALEGIGVKYVKTDVGDKNVYDAMANGKLSLGGEESGHIIFSKYASTGDGILTAIKIMEVLIESKQTSDRLCMDFKLYPQSLVNVKVSDKDGAILDKNVQKTLHEVEKTLGSSGRILLRKSGTEPVVRVMAEAETKTACDNAVEKLVREIKKSGKAIE